MTKSLTESMRLLPNMLCIVHTYTYETRQVRRTLQG